MRIGYLANLNFGIRTLGINQDQVAQSAERLITGKKVNRASDDPSAIVPIEEHKARIYSLESELKSLKQQESYLGAKEGGLSVVSDMLAELNGLVVQAANNAGSSDEEQKSLKLEIESVLEGIDHIANSTAYKGQLILQEYTSGSIADKLDELATLAFEDPEAAQEIAKDSVDGIARSRAAIGNQLKTIDSKQSVNTTELINLTDSLSNLEDTDYAEETAKLVRAQILEQATIMTMGVSRQNAEQVLNLIGGATDSAKSALGAPAQIGI
tara:strand:+ start:677 stop:1483 length:807 start_codon:yes stop_codon:yes gene_type:complete